jgi:hypothetical protein
VSAPTVIKQLVAQDIGELKGVASGTSMAAVTAFKEPLPALEGKLEQGLHAAGNEAVNGLRTVERNIEDHPELIAESVIHINRSCRIYSRIDRGAVAVAIGVGSLVQPELVSPGLALVGKIATDCAVRTVEEIAAEDGFNGAKAIARDVVDNSSKVVATALTKAKVVALDVTKDLSNAIPTVNIHAAMDVSPKAKESVPEGVKAVTNVSHSTPEPALGDSKAAGPRIAVATMLTVTTQALRAKVKHQIQRLQALGPRKRV